MTTTSEKAVQGVDAGELAERLRSLRDRNGELRRRL